nr:hypothetical protein [Tanacetum cinerariifolium]
MESIHVNFDELPQMASDQISSDPAHECQTMALNHDSLSPTIQCQTNVSQADRTVKMSNELDLLFSPMFDELLNGSSKVVLKSFTVSAADAINQRQQYSTPLNNHTTPAPTCLIPTLAPTIISSENINQAELNAENDQVTDDEFINIFSTPVQDQGEMSSRHVDSSNMHTFYQRYPYTWTHFLRSKDETPEVLIDFLRLVQGGLQAQVIVVRTDKGTEFMNQTLHAYFAAEGIQHQTSVARTPEQNGVVERRNRTLVEAARTMLSAAKVPLFFWAEAIATACFTQNRSLVIPRHEKTPYHIINELKPSVKFFHIFGSVCYIVRDGENLDKMKEKGDECIFVGYSTQSRAYRVYNKRTRVIMESIHVNFDELPRMASAHNSSDPAPTCPTMASAQISSDPAPECQHMALEHSSLNPGRNCQENVSHGDKTDTTSNELDLLFSPMFDELLNGSTKVVSMSSDVSAADAPNQRHQPTTPLNPLTTPDPTCQTPPITTSVISSENVNQAEPHAENDEVADDEFINIFSTPVQDKGETSSRHVDSSNIHTFYPCYPSEQRWTKEHPLEQVIGNPSQSVRTRHQLESDAEMCMFALTSRAYRVFNKRTRVIMESIHVNFDELPQMASVQDSSDPAPTRQSMASVQDSSDPAPTRQSMASVQDSSDPAPTRQSTTLAHNSSNPAPTCQTMASVQISFDPAPECQTMVLKHSSLSPGRKCQENDS